MSETNLTDASFWRRYWQGKEAAFDLVVTDKHLFADVILAYIPKTIRSFMEIGGFPGYFSILFKKLYAAEAKLCDIYIDEAAINRLCRANEVHGIELMRGDIFKSNPGKVDVVLSAGLIEHFSDSAAIIRKHFELVNDGGYVIIGVPNFLGLNGWLQRVADDALYRAHNLEAMRLAVLAKECEANNAEVLHLGYYGKFALWLENFQDRPFVIRVCLSLINKLRHLIWFESKWLSPYIICIAHKREID